MRGTKDYIQLTEQEEHLNPGHLNRTPTDSEL